MFIATEWEMFYTNSKKGEDYVNQICIDLRNKRYIIDADVTILATDGCDEEGNEFDSVYVSEFVFNSIVDSVKKNGFDEYKNSSI